MESTWMSLLFCFLSLEWGKWVQMSPSPQTTQEMLLPGMALSALQCHAGVATWGLCGRCLMAQRWGSGGEGRDRAGIWFLECKGDANEFNHKHLLSTCSVIFMVFWEKERPRVHAVWYVDRTCRFWQRIYALDECRSALAKASIISHVPFIMCTFCWAEQY